MALLAIPALAATVALAPAASAQEEPPEECALLTAQEVGGALDMADIALSGGSTYCCSFDGDTVSLYLALQPGEDLAAIKTGNPGGIELTVGGRPAWFVADSGTIWVDAGGQVLSISTYGGAADEALQAALIELAELALPRAPAGPSPEDLAAVKALIPETIGDEPVTVQAFTGPMLLAFGDLEEPRVKALIDALAAQGKAATDMLLASGNVGSDSDSGVLVVRIKGADLTGLVLTIVDAFVPEPRTQEPTTKQVGGKTVTVISGDEVTHGYASGDTVYYANGPDDFLESFFAALP